MELQSKPRRYLGCEGGRVMLSPWELDYCRGSRHLLVSEGKEAQMCSGGKMGEYLVLVWEIRSFQNWLCGPGPIFSMLGLPTAARMALGTPAQTLPGRNSELPGPKKLFQESWESFSTAAA